MFSRTFVDSIKCPTCSGKLRKKDFLEKSVIQMNIEEEIRIRDDLKKE